MNSEIRFDHRRMQSAQKQNPPPLWVTFWVQGVIPNTMILAAVLPVSTNADVSLRTFLLSTYLVHTFLVIRRIWLTAEQAERSYFGALARGMCVAWTANALFLSAFLAIGK